MAELPRPSRYTGGTRRAVSFLLLAVALAATTGLIIVLPSATVTVRVATEPIVRTFTVTLDLGVAEPMTALGIIPGKPLAASNPAVVLELAAAGWQFDHRFVLDGPGGRYLVLFRRADLEHLAAVQLTSVLRGDRTLSPGTLRLTVLQVEANQAGTGLRLAVQAEGVTVPILPIQGWRRTAGHRVDALGELLAQSPEVQSVQVEAWPAFWPLLPFLPSRLRFSLDTP